MYAASIIILPLPHLFFWTKMSLSKSTRDVLAGTSGGIAQVLVGQPFDIVKVRLQTSAPGQYKSIVDCAGQILKNKGVLGFYSGTLTPLLGVGACVSIQFGVVGAIKRYFENENKLKGITQLTNLQLYTAGALAGTANSVVAGPIEHIRIRLQAQQEIVFKGPLDCAKQIMQKSGNGVFGIFRGMTSTILREGHGMGVYFLTYEFLVQRQLGTKSRQELSNTLAMTFGATAGITLWLSAYPIDIVKSKMQTDAIIPSERKYNSTLQCIQSIYKQAGIKGFFRGLLPTLIRAPFANAATFVAYETASRHLDKYVKE